MNKKSWIIIIILLIILIVGGIYFYYSSNMNKTNEKDEYQANRTSTNSTNENKTDSPPSNENISTETKKEPQYKEEQISTFSTTIYSKDSARQNNIKITCNTLNDTIVKNGEIFSFCNVVGQSTTAKGYQKADIYDNNGKKKKGLGGGNCQVSSTLYNCVLSVPSLVVTERHEHSNRVPYVAKGKDAAVAYGSYDFKFRNNSGNTIKINCSTDEKNITVSLISMKEI